MQQLRNYVNEFTGNRILNAALLSMFTAQVLKVLIIWVATKRFQPLRAFGTGGMPSSHTALVVGLAASIGKWAGLYSPSFAVSVVFAIIVMYDSSNIRRSAGEQAKVINYMMQNWDEHTDVQAPDLFAKQLKELLGHKPVEVLAGAAVGLVFGILM